MKSASVQSLIKTVLFLLSFTCIVYVGITARAASDYTVEEKKMLYDTENRIRQDILVNGIKDRLCLDVAPPIEATGTDIRINIKGDHGKIRVVFENPLGFPIDLPETWFEITPQKEHQQIILPPSVDMSGHRLIIWAQKSIHRYEGKVIVGKYTLIGEGEKANRLTFVVLSEGYVYLRGKGTVILPDGKEVKLGNP